MRILLAILLSATVANAATWYAAAGGSSTNGTSPAPWSIEYAVTNGNPYLAAGDTVILKAGTFVCYQSNTVYETGWILPLTKSGTPEAKITYQAESLWGFAFDGGLLFADGAVSNVVVRNCRIFWSGSTNRNRTNKFTHPAGIYDTAQGNEFLHNLIENTGHPGIGSWPATRGKNISGNIIRFVGFNDYSPPYTGGARGSGMYLQNLDDSSEALIRGNISFQNFTTGMKAFGNADIWGFHFLNNIAAHNNEAGVFYHQDNYGSEGVTVSSNYLWFNGTGVRLGLNLGNGGHSNAVVVGNYAVENPSEFIVPFYMVDGWGNATWTNNTGVNTAMRYQWTLETFGETGGDVASHTIDFNDYYGVNAGGYGAGPFSVKETQITFDAWRATVHGDTNSSFTYGTPTNRVFAFRPSDDTNFVHIAAFNWTTNASATVDLSAYFSTNDTLAIYDAQNAPTAYTNLTYAGGAVPLDMSLTNRAEYSGGTWDGFDPRFRTFVVHRTATGEPEPDPPTQASGVMRIYSY